VFSVLRDVMSHENIPAEVCGALPLATRCSRGIPLVRVLACPALQGELVSSHRKLLQRDATILCATRTRVGREEENRQAAGSSSIRNRQPREDIRPTHHRDKQKVGKPLIEKVAQELVDAE
jgi:hypothetical protein